MARILAISHDASLYGAQRSLLDAVTGLAAAGHDVEVCVPAPGELVNKLRDRRVLVRVVRFGRWIPAVSPQGAWWHWLRYLLFFPVGLARSMRLLRAGRYDVVYTNTVTVLDMAVAAKLSGVPHVWHLRESAAGNPHLRTPLSNSGVIRVAGALSARVIYNSWYLLGRYKRQPGGEDIVVHNGLAPPPAPGELPPRSDGRLVLVTIGFMDRRKGLDVLLDALTLLPAALRARIVVRVAGHMDEAYRAAELLPRLQRLGDTVQLLGWVEDVHELLAGADLLISSAREEPFGRTLVEAMMAGVPVLATRSGGPQEIVVDGETGVLVPPEDPAQLAAALGGLAQDPQRRAALGRAGRERALARFSVDAYVRGVEQCLLQAIAEAQCPDGARAAGRRP